MISSTFTPHPTMPPSRRHKTPQMPTEIDLREVSTSGSVRAGFHAGSVSGRVKSSTVIRSTPRSSAYCRRPERTGRVDIEECEPLSALECAYDLLQERYLPARRAEHQCLLSQIIRREPTHDVRAVRSGVRREGQAEPVPAKLLVEETIAREVEVAQTLERARARRLVAERNLMRRGGTQNEERATIATATSAASANQIHRCACRPIRRLRRSTAATRGEGGGPGRAAIRSPDRTESGPSGQAVGGAIAHAATSRVRPPARVPRSQTSRARSCRRDAGGRGTDTSPVQGAGST